MIKRRKKEAPDLSIVQIPLAMFLQSYNENLPESFPRVSVTILKRFQTAYPMLFKHGNMWSIALHRKKVIDWLPSHREGS